MNILAKNLFSELKKGSYTPSAASTKDESSLFDALKGDGWLKKTGGNTFGFKAVVENVKTSAQQTDYSSMEIVDKLELITEERFFVPWTTQGSRPICVATATAKVAYVRMIRDAKNAVAIDPLRPRPVLSDGSMLLPQNYPSAEAIHRWGGGYAEEGIDPRNGMKVISKRGCCPDIIWKTSLTAPIVDEPYGASVAAGKNKYVSGYARIDSFDEALRMVALNRPFTVTIDLPAMLNEIINGESQDFFATPGETVGRHCMAVWCGRGGETICADSSWDCGTRMIGIDHDVWKQCNAVGWVVL